jgi:hypothetical protein
VLADRGLVAAVQSLADRSGISVTVSSDIDHRPPPVVETAAYFAAAESLTNTAKHAPGAHVRIVLWGLGLDFVMQSPVVCITKQSARRVHGQTRAPSEDVTRGGIMDGYQSIKRVFQLGSRYSQQVARVRAGIGIYLLVLMAVLYGSGHGGQWAWLLAVTAALHFGLAYRLFRIARKDPDRLMTFH